jgi:hypothetical protein
MGFPSGSLGTRNKSFWWHRHLAGAVHRLEACATETKFLVFSTRFFFKLIDLTME